MSAEVESVNTTPIPRTCRTSAHVNLSRVAQDNICVSQNSHLHIQHAMSHAQSLLFPPRLTSSAHSTSTSNPTPSWYGDDQHYVATFGPLAEPQIPIESARPRACADVLTAADTSRREETMKNI